VTTPFAHQEKARGLSRGREFFALFMEMGTGKSFCDVLDTIDHMADGLDGWLVVAPKGTYANWIGEIDKHLPPEIGRDVHLWAGGGSKGEQRIIDALCRQRPAGRLRVLVMNVEALSMSKRARMAASRFLASCRAAKMTVDESTCIKTPGSERTKQCVALGRQARWRRILTGMPITKSPLDLYGQFDFLSPGCLGFRNFWSFRGTYSVMRKIMVGARKVDIVVGYRGLEDLQARAARHSFRVTKEECLDLPPKIYQMRDVELTEKQQELYAKVRDDATAQLESGDHVTATEAMTQILRLHQIVCGHVVDEAGVLHDVPSNRIGALTDILGETSGKVIIWAPYRRCVQQIREALAEEFGAPSVVQYDGAVADDDRRLAIQRFQGTPQEPHDPDCRFFVGNPATGGFGITLTRATTVIYFANGYSLEKRMQSEDRPHRHGQTLPVNIVDMIARGTVEERVVKTLRKGIDIASAVVGDGWREWVI
jgi:SNF2 family DNA or RNA helicase